MATATRVGGDKESIGNGDAIATATRVARVEEGNDKGGKGNGDGNGNKEGHSNQRQQHRQWRQQRGWWASNSNNGNGERGGTKDTASRATTGKRGMMVAMSHGLCAFFCVCGETTKNKVGPKKGECNLDLIACLGLAIGKTIGETG
jgi:hypothetical protein